VVVCPGTSGNGIIPALPFSGDDKLSSSSIGAF